MEALKLTQEKYQQLPDISLNQIVVTFPDIDYPEEIHSLTSAKIFPFLTEITDGTNRFVCLFGSSISPEHLLLLTNSLSRFPFYNHKMAARADIRQVNDHEVVEAHSKMIQQGFFNKDDENEFQRLDEGDDFIVKAKIGLKNTIVQKADQLKAALGAEVINQDEIITIPIDESLILSYRGNFPLYYLLIYKKRLIHQMVMRKEARQYTRYLKAQDLKDFLTDERQGISKSQRSTTEVVPTMIFDFHPDGSITIPRINKSARIEEVAQQIFLQSLQPDHRFPVNSQDLEFDYPTAHAMSGFIALGLMDKEFVQEIQNHPYVRGDGHNSPDGSFGQEMESLQLILLPHVLRDIQQIPLSKYPIFVNLVNILSQYSSVSPSNY